MKINRSKLRQIIKEETQNILKEGLIGDLSNPQFGPGDEEFDALKLALSDRGLMKEPVESVDTMVPFNQVPSSIVASLPVKWIAYMISNLYHNEQLSLGFDEDTYKMMDDFTAVTRGQEPRYGNAYKLRNLFGGLHPKLDRLLP